MARFLVIDDDTTLRHLMVLALEGAGHRVMQAASGAEATRLFALQRPDVVITDIIMPDDSIEHVISLHQDNPETPFIVVSGLAARSTQTLEVEKLLKARRTVPKPFRLPDFLAITNQVLAELNLA